MWWYTLCVFGGAIAGYFLAALMFATDSKPKEELQRAYNKGLAEGPAYWRNRAARSDESARILGEGLKKAMAERDEARAAPDTEALREAAQGLLALMDEVPIDPSLGDETDRVFSRAEFAALRKALGGEA